MCAGGMGGQSYGMRPMQPMNRGFNPYGQSSYQAFQPSVQPRGDMANIVPGTPGGSMNSGGDRGTYVNPINPTPGGILPGGPDIWQMPHPTPMLNGSPGVPAGMNPNLNSSGQGMDPRTGLPYNVGFMIPRV